MAATAYMTPPPSSSSALMRRAHELLTGAFALESFRPWQEEAVQALLEGERKVLVVAPTGGGKSLTYQLPATVLPGTTLVLSPLVALMEDQVRGLTARGIPSTYIASTLAMETRREREAGLLSGKYKIVYAAPERLASDAFVNLLARADLSLVAIDEAHCIAQWGHDFRPDYLRIGALLERIKPERLLACTATATPEVRREILAQLGLDRGNCHEVLRGFARPNLHLEARSVDGPKGARLAMLAALEQAIGKPGTGSKGSAKGGGAIVYAATRKVSEETAGVLRDKGYRAAFYHAGIDASDRTRVAGGFARGELDVVVATNAFGMGIDRPDIRVVVHVQPPATIEAYYQEVGRAGRDGAEAHGLLLCSGLDISLRRRLVQMGSDGQSADPAQAARGWSQFRELLRYMDARSCRHDFVLRYFGDEREILGGCGHCDVCEMLDGEAAPADGADAAVDEETTLVVRKALSGVARAQRRAGLQAVADMLRGVDSERTRKFGFTELSTFGLLKERSADWVVALLRALLAAGWIDLTPTEHPVPFVTKAGTEVMRAAAPARILLPSDVAARRPGGRGSESSGARERKSSNALPAADLDAEGRRLFEALRAVRLGLAKERGIPPYVVAHDRTLVELATARPRSRAELQGIHGLGPQRIETYGEALLAALTDSG